MRRCQDPGARPRGQPRAGQGDMACTLAGRVAWFTAGTARPAHLTGSRGTLQLAQRHLANTLQAFKWRQTVGSTMPMAWACTIRVAHIVLVLGYTTAGPAAAINRDKLRKGQPGLALFHAFLHPWHHHRPATPKGSYLPFSGWAGSTGGMGARQHRTCALACMGAAPCLPTQTICRTRCTLLHVLALATSTHDPSTPCEALCASVLLKDSCHTGQGMVNTHAHTRPRLVGVGQAFERVIGELVPSQVCVPLIANTPSSTAKEKSLAGCMPFRARRPRS